MPKASEMTATPRRAGAAAVVGAAAAVATERMARPGMKTKRRKSKSPPRITLANATTTLKAREKRNGRTAGVVVAVAPPKMRKGL
jgi:hypothetical protein